MTDLTDPAVDPTPTDPALVRAQLRRLRAEAAEQRRYLDSLARRARDEQRHRSRLREPRGRG